MGLLHGAWTDPLRERSVVKPKAILTLALLAFMAASVGYFAISEVRQWRTPESDLGGAGHRIGVY